jgi:two-component system response regulator BaeR
LYSNANRIYARAQIMDLVYKDYRDISDRTVDSHIRNLRKKLSALTIKNDLIRSIYGVGYKFEPI